ncbi:hypothetical protein TNCV_2713631 [Trichonephila clavipes]|nr:hypothetical protein TNCV_2713631 [Trichonephila clavipes]
MLHFALCSPHVASRISFHPTQQHFGDLEPWSLAERRLSNPVTSLSSIAPKYQNQWTTIPDKLDMPRTRLWSGTSHRTGNTSSWVTAHSEAGLTQGNTPSGHCMPQAGSVDTFISFSVD